MYILQSKPSCDGARHNIQPSSVRKVCDEHYSACKLPDQKKTAMRAQCSTACHMGGKKVGGHNTQQISHAQLQGPPPILTVETLKNRQQGAESGCLTTTELQLWEQLRPLTYRPPKLQLGKELIPRLVL